MKSQKKGASSVEPDDSMPQYRKRGADDNMDEFSSIFRIPPFSYVHVLDQNSNVTRVETGPQTFIRKDFERVLMNPVKMVVVPPRHYCIVANPVARTEDGIITDVAGQVRLDHGEIEVRLEQEPFPLYPGEVLHTDVEPLKVVHQHRALRLRAVRDFGDDTQRHVAGDEWLFEGPGTFIPRKEVEILSTVKAVIIAKNQALKLRATRDTVDRNGEERVTGEEWLVKRTGAYLPGAYEEVVEMVNAYVLTEQEAVEVKAIGTFTDQFGVRRRNGEEWLVKHTDTETYIPGVYEKVLTIIKIITLTNRQYCVICDPLGEDGKPQLGQKKLVKGEKSFFLQPGEHLENGIQTVFVLSDIEGLILRCLEEFVDDSVDPHVTRKPGDRWMIVGPIEYVPPVEVEVVTQRQAIPLHENEGIYVRNIKTGRVRAVIGETYMLTHDEELWSKEIPDEVIRLLGSGHDMLADRGVRYKPVQQQQQQQQDSSSVSSWDKTLVITYKVPHNACVQIYDYKEKRARVIFGPDLVMLGPDEQFTQLSLSGGKPKKPNQIRTLGLLLGPDFCTDIITVETADHAKLQLQLSYNWHFDTGDRSQQSAAKLFSVPDFIGDACKAIASRVRGAVASVQFDDFHKNSARIIRTSVFGLDENQKVRKEFRFPQNNFIVTSIDVQGVEPVDQRTRDSLQKSVQLAIEITTNSQEATARHEAERIEQESKGRLEQQKILDLASAERIKKELLELQAASSAVESCGQAKAEAQSRAESAKIEGEAAVTQAGLKAEAMKIETDSEMERLEKARNAELRFIAEQNNLEVAKMKELSKIEVDKFQNMMEALGSDTLREMATAGLDHQVSMLQALGLKSTLITDGRTPINLLNAAHGLLGTSTGEDSSLTKD